MCMRSFPGAEATAPSPQGTCCWPCAETPRHRPQWLLRTQMLCFLSRNLQKNINSSFHDFLCERPGETVPSGSHLGTGTDADTTSGSLSMPVSAFATRRMLSPPPVQREGPLQVCQGRLLAEPGCTVARESCGSTLRLSPRLALNATAPTRRAWTGRPLPCRCQPSGSQVGFA